MRTINTTFKTFGASLLLLGLKGDSNATEILIDCAESLEEYQGTMAAMSITGPDDTVYPGDISLDENGIVHWVVAARDCGIAGHGSARVDLVDDEGTVVASAEARTIIMKTNMQGVAPDQIANWTEAASVALQEARAALLDLIDIDTTATANEAARQLAETGRVSAETLRASAETARASAETLRASEETARASAETLRASAETDRASAESTRIAAEAARVSEFSTIEANAQAALSYIGPSEASSTASAAHTKGTYFTYNGKLYEATADIAAGDTITAGTNCAQVPGGAMGEVFELKSATNILEQSADRLNVYYNSFKLGYYFDNKNPGSAPDYRYDSGFVCCMISVPAKNVDSITLYGAILFDAIPFKNGLNLAKKVNSLSELLSYDFDQFAVNFRNADNPGGYDNLNIQINNKNTKLDEYSELINHEISLDDVTTTYNKDVLNSGYFFDNGAPGTAVKHVASDDFKCCLLNKNNIVSAYVELSLQNATLYDYVLYRDGKTIVQAPHLTDLQNLIRTDFDQIGLNFQNSQNPNGYDDIAITMTSRSAISEAIQRAQQKYAGKTLTVIGDSITAGYGVTKPYSTWLGEKLGLGAVRNLGSNGARLSGMITTVNSATVSDVNIVFGGTNDFALGNTPLGELYTLSSGTMVPNMDTSTFYGVLNTLFVSAIKRFKGNRFVMLTPIHRERFSSQYTDREPNSAGLYLYQYVEAIEKASEFWGVQVVNLYKGFMYNPNISEIKSEYFQTNDGLHPNEAGHEMLANCIVDLVFT